ncbi:MAG: hypothetical protein ACI9YO_000345, partial [Gammaproteobacteria bacterium]
MRGDMSFSFDKFVTEARAAAVSDEPTHTIRTLMRKALETPEAL